MKVSISSAFLVSAIRILEEDGKEHDAQSIERQATTMTWRVDCEGCEYHL